MCRFRLSQILFGYYSRLGAPKYALLKIAEGEGHILVRAKVQRVNVGNFRENSRETVSVLEVTRVWFRPSGSIFVKITRERFHHKQKTSECSVRKKWFGTHSLILFPFYAAADSTL